MTGNTCILMCQVKTFLSSSERSAPNNQTSMKTEQGRWKKPKTKLVIMIVVYTINSNLVLFNYEDIFKNLLFETVLSFKENVRFHIVFKLTLIYLLE